LVPDKFVAKRHDLVYTALWPLVPKERVPVDLRHVVTSMAGRAVFDQHVDEARKGLVPRVKTPSVRASALANANVTQIFVSNDRDPFNHLGRANMGI